MLIVTYAFYDVNLYLVPQNKLGWVIILNKFILSIFIFMLIYRVMLYPQTTLQYFYKLFT